MPKVKAPEDRKCKCGKKAAPSKTKCWACIKREYRARKKNDYNKYVKRCTEIGVEPMDASAYGGLLKII